MSGFQFNTLLLVERLVRWGLRRRGFTTCVRPASLGDVRILAATGRGPLPTVALLHGLGSSAAAYGGVLRRLPQHHRRVAALDLPGHGTTAPPAGPLTPEALLDAVTVGLEAASEDPFILVGNSLGGALAARYAARHPDRVAGLVLVSPAGAPIPEPDMDGIRRLYAMPSRRDAVRFLECLYDRPPVLRHLIAGGVRQLMRRPFLQGFLRDVRPEDGLQPDELARLRMPILLLWGRSERLLPESCLDWFRDHLPRHAAVERPDGFGHCPQLEHPARLAQRIVAFARDVAAACRAEEANEHSS